MLPAQDVDKGWLAVPRVPGEYPAYHSVGEEVFSPVALEVEALKPGTFVPIQAAVRATRPYTRPAQWPVRPSMQCWTMASAASGFPEI
jgi:hypothetical protein